MRYTNMLSVPFRSIFHSCLAIYRFQLSIFKLKNMICIENGTSLNLFLNVQAEEEISFFLSILIFDILVLFGLIFLFFLLVRSIFFWFSKNKKSFALGWYFGTKFHKNCIRVLDCAPLPVVVPKIFGLPIACTFPFFLSSYFTLMRSRWKKKQTLDCDAHLSLHTNDKTCSKYFSPIRIVFEMWRSWRWFLSVSLVLQQQRHSPSALLFVWSRSCGPNWRSGCRQSSSESVIGKIAEKVKRTRKKKWKTNSNEDESTSFPRVMQRWRDKM